MKTFKFKVVSYVKMVGLRVLCIFAVFVSIFAGDLPAYFPVCYRDDPNLDKCLVDAAHTVKPHLKNGIRELNIPNLNPLILPKILLEQGTQAISYKVTLTNVTVRGLEDFVFTALRFDQKTFTLSGTITFEKVAVISNYDIDGKILVAPIKGRGILDIKAGPLNSTFSITGKLQTRGDHDYITPTNITLAINVAAGTAHFKGVINDNEELSAITNRILNENSQELLRDAVPALEKVAEELITRLWGEINSIVPYHKILPLSH